MVAPNIVPVKFPDPNEDLEGYIEVCETIFPKNKTIPFRTKKPVKWASEAEKVFWEEDEIRKCLYGDGLMCGSQYFYFTYCRIKNLSEGVIRPEFRVADNEYFKQLESCFIGGDNSGWGLITVKRRRAGFTWKAACFMLWLAIFFTGRRIGFDSKTEKDSFKLMNNFIKFIYEGLPSFIKAGVDGGYNKANIIFSVKTQDEKGEAVQEGALSEIYCSAPVPEAHEGEMLHLWVSDEAGKKSSLLPMWELTLPCMEQEGVRLGVPLIFGTAGDVDKGSQGLSELWKNYKAYKLIPFFFAGWMGMECDEYGNDNVREAVESIIRKRNAMAKTNNSGLFAYIQQYPLTPEEALRAAEVKGIGNEVEIERRLEELRDNPPSPTFGRFRWGDPKRGEGKVIFDPISPSDHRRGQHDFLYATVYNHPFEEDKYDAGCDPADHDYVQKKASDMSMYIVRRPTFNNLNKKLVFKMTGRPKLASDFYDQALMALIYYNETQVLIEKNRYRMISHFEREGFDFLLKPEPIAIESRNKRQKGNYGINKNTTTQQRMERCINEYTDESIDCIDDESLLQEFSDYGEKNTDEVIAFGWTLVSLEDSLQDPANRPQAPDTTPRTASRLVRGPNGNIKREFYQVNNGYN
jgi:hypothetical protein